MKKLKDWLKHLSQTLKNPGGLPPVADLFRETWQIYRTHFRGLFGLAALGLVGVAFTLPGLLMAVVGVAKSGSLVMARPTDFWAHLGLTAIGALITIVVSVFVRTSLNAAAHAGINEAKVSGRAALLHGWKVFWQYALTTVVLALITGAGFALLFVPGLVVATYFLFAEQAVVLEELRWLDPFRRSLQLVAGRFWAIFWRLLAGWVIYGLLTLLASAILVQLPLAIVTNLLALHPATLRVMLVPLELLGGAVTALIVPLYVVYQVQIYNHLKRLVK